MSQTQNQIDSNSFKLLFFGLAIVGVGNSMMFAILPPIAREIKMPDWTVSAIFSLSAILWTITSPIWGKLSDRLGRKPGIVIGLGGYAMSTLAFTIISALIISFNWHWGLALVCLAFARAIYGGFGSATNPSAQAYIADGTTEEVRTREISAITSAFAFGTAFGPAIAAAMIAPFGILSPLIAVSIIAIIGVGLIHWHLPVIPMKHSESKTDFSQIFALANRKSVRPWLVFGIGLSSVNAVLYQQLTFYYIDRLHVTPVGAASLAAFALSAGAFAQIAAQLGLLPRFNASARTFVVWGTILTAIGAGLTYLGDKHEVLVLGQMFIGLGFGLARPGFTGGASLAAGKSEQGAIAGLIISSNGAGFVLAPIFGSGLYHLSPQAPFLLCTIALVLLAFYGHSRKDLDTAKASDNYETGAL